MLKRTHIQSQPALNYAGSGGAPGILTEENEVLILAEVGETAAETHPGRDRRYGKQVYPGGRSNEDLFVIAGSKVARVDVLIQIEHRGDLSRVGVDGGSEKAARIVHFEGQPFAGPN